MVQDKEVTITRTFNAPRELVWKAWTEPDRIAQWFGPKGWPMTVHNMDLRVGGSFHHCWRMPDGKEGWSKWVFREIDPPSKLVVVQCFSDPEGRVKPHPMMPDWPMETLSTVTFEERDGQTLLTFRKETMGATEAEIAAFDIGMAGMAQGLVGTFEQLDAYLASVR
jgi:uncharacterized protein YndB with AHSA1/START domain